MANDTASWPGELPFITDESDYYGFGELPGPHASVWHNGLTVALIADGAGEVVPDTPSYDYKVWRYNGTSWDNLDFPATLAFAASADPADDGGVFPAYPVADPFHMSLVSDGTTLWFAFIVAETLDNANAGPGNPDTWWRNTTTYVFSYSDSSGWTQAYASESPIRRDSYEHRLATHEGAGYCWLVSNETGPAGVSYHDPVPIGGGGIFPFIYFTHYPPYADSYVTAVQISDAGVVAEQVGLAGFNPPWYLDLHPDSGTQMVDEGSPLWDGSYTGRGIESGDARVFALATAAGFPVVVSNIFSGKKTDQLLAGTTDPDTDVYQPPLSAFRADTFEQLQATDDVQPIGSQRVVYSPVVNDDLLYLITTRTAQAGVADDLFYPEEIDLSEGTTDDFNRVRIFTLPVDAASEFSPLHDSHTEDVSLAKNPLKTFGPQDWSRLVSLFAAVTPSGNIWILTHCFAATGDGIILPFVLGRCPLPADEHGRYAWDWAQDSFGYVYVAPYASSEFDPGFTMQDWFVGPAGDVLEGGVFSTVYSPTEARIYVVAWAKYGDGTIYLRAWYFPICVGCDQCVQGLHVWQRV